MEHGLDHFFILTEPGAPQADLLVAAGFEEGERNRHNGQGTANRRFFFADTMLELLYVVDEAEADQGRGHRLRLPERASNADASPFGLVLRESAEPGSPRFSGWEYFPEYLPNGGFLRIGHNSNELAEPLCIALPPNFPQVLGKARQRRAQSRVTALCISVPVNQPSEILESMARIEPISLRFGEPHRMEVILDHGTLGKKTDFRPRLPLLVRW